MLDDELSERYRLASANGGPQTPVSATVVDCAYSATELVHKATRKPVPPVTLTGHMAAHEARRQSVIRATA